MGTIGFGYGSEWHMLRMMGRHRAWFSRQVLAVTGGKSVTWNDFDFTGAVGNPPKVGDAETKNVDFLADVDAARKEWSQWWPQTGNVPNWDAIGVHRIQGVDEWLLVEAKAHLDELKQCTGAKSKSESPRGKREQIEARLAETQKAMGLPGDLDWTSPYYQYANRLAVLHFLAERGIPARVVFVYFTGDVAPNKVCPKSETHWLPSLAAMKQHLRLTGKSVLERRVHEVFVPVVG